MGGRLADRWPSPRLLGFIVLAGAVLTAVIPFVARPFLNVTINGIDSVSTGAVLGSFFACVILFVPSVLLLGMVDAVRHPPRHPGHGQGRDPLPAASSPFPRPAVSWGPSCPRS